MFFFFQKDVINFLIAFHIIIPFHINHASSVPKPSHDLFLNITRIIIFGNWNETRMNTARMGHHWLAKIFSRHKISKKRSPRSSVSIKSEEFVAKIFSKYKNLPKIVAKDLRIFNILCSLQTDWWAFCRAHMSRM